MARRREHHLRICVSAYLQAKGESGDWGYTYAGKGSTYTNWQLFGAK